MLRKVALLPLLALLMVPAVGHALGLGEVRVLSSLNEPLEAEIALSDLRSGELDALQVRLASTEAFARVGLDRPFLLTQLQFETARNDADQPVIRVTTQEAVREPFLNFLIEANWSRGRLLREYTVLLDPPVLMPAIAGSMQPARTEPAPRPGRTEPQAPARENPPSLDGRIPEDRMRAGPGSYGAIQRDETLWSIAERVKPSADITTSQMMLALFEANPEAFYGNINRMKTGYILRIPARDAVMQRSAAEAVQEVARQNEAWRTGEAIDFQIAEAGPAAGDDQLRLTAPATDADGDDPAGTGEGADTGLQGQLAAAEDAIAEERAARESLADRLVELETETERLRRELEIRNAELAAIASGTAMPERPAEQTPADEAPADDAADAPADEPAAEEEPAADPRRSVRTVPEEPTLVERLMSPLWLGIILGVLAVILILTLALRRHRASQDAHRALAPETDDDATQFDAAEAVDAEGEQTVLRPDDETFEEAAAAAPEPAPEPEPEPAEDLDTSGVMALDEGDPASEADFHLAYGLYDQAADLMEGAYKQHPDRVDYLMKLLEIYFAWGKADEFIAHAREGRGKLEAAGEWGNVAILGRQMKADEPLFSDMAGTGARAGVDLDVEGDSGGQPMDLDTGTFEGEFDLGEPDAAEAPAAPAGNEVEFDLGDFDYDAAAAEAGPEAAPDDGTQAFEAPAEAADDNSLDFDLDLGDDAAAETPAAEPADDENEATQFKVEPSADDGSFDMDFDAALEGLETESDSAGIESELAGDDTAATALGAGTGETPADDGMDLDFDALLEDDGDAEPDADAGSTDSRLDLARAYIDMGDADGARTLLDEVVASGDDAQKAEAQELLKLIS